MKFCHYSPVSFLGVVSFFFFLSFSFSELSNVICLCAAVHVCLWDEAAGTEPETKRVDFVLSIERRSGSPSAEGRWCHPYRLLRLQPSLQRACRAAAGCIRPPARSHLVPTAASAV